MMPFNVCPISMENMKRGTKFHSPISADTLILNPEIRIKVGNK